MFQKVMVVNRGEIAVRVMQTLQEMGITTVAVYSDPDEKAEHVRVADEAYHLPGKTAAETYLKVDKLLQIAKSAGVEAIHPGYGFLSESAPFAEACEKAGVVFIGPKPEVIRDMGDKIIAKTLMDKAGVPVVPGWSGEADTPYDTIAAKAREIGYPVLVKAAAGGGGKGMRMVTAEADLKAALEAAAREAKNAFGDARVFLEKYIVKPRHIEFQIFGDHHGNVVHLFERECSIQRRHQKIIEETPSPALTPELRAKMGDAAVAAAKAMGYTNAGTVEFILGEDGSFYFLEVNTRLQVEHPVTEMTVHRDLVRLQLAVAAGEKLPFTQADLKQDGHAIECRIYAEDPVNNFLPGIGTVDKYVVPVGPGIRVDNGIRQGSEVSIYYDPMLSKLIVWGKNRSEALEKMHWALSRYVILGVANNVAFLRAIIEHPAFRDGRIHTHFLEEHPIGMTSSETPVEALLLAAMASQTFRSNVTAGGTKSPQNGGGNQYSSDNSPWLHGGGWRPLASCPK